MRQALLGNMAALRALLRAFVADGLAKSQQTAEEGQLSVQPAHAVMNHEGGRELVERGLSSIHGGYSR